MRGLPSNEKVISAKFVSNRHLLKTRGIDGRTVRYVSCPAGDNPLFFRVISTSDRKRIGKNCYESLWDRIQWEKRNNRWVGTYGGMEIRPRLSSINESPEGDNQYWVDNKLVSTAAMLEIVSAV